MATLPTRDNSGALFKNLNKKDDKQPDYRGDCMINGEQKQISAWIRKSKSGMSFMSLAFSEPYQKNATQTQSKPQSKIDPADMPGKPTEPTEEMDDVPF